MANLRFLQKRRIQKTTSSKNEVENFLPKEDPSIISSDSLKQPDQMPKKRIFRLFLRLECKKGSFNRNMIDLIR